MHWLASWIRSETHHARLPRAHSGGARYLSYDTERSRSGSCDAGVGLWVAPCALHPCTPPIKYPYTSHASLDSNPTSNSVATKATIWCETNATARRHPPHFAAQRWSSRRRVRRRCRKIESLFNFQDLQDSGPTMTNIPESPTMRSQPFAALGALPLVGIEIQRGPAFAARAQCRQAKSRLLACRTTMGAMQVTGILPRTCIGGAH